MSRLFTSGLSTLSSIRNQLTELTSEVLNESTQEVADPVSELSVAKKRVAELEQALASRNNEVDRLRTSNGELQERVSAFEYELHQASEQYRRQNEEKEAEILRLKAAFVPSSSGDVTIHGPSDGSFSPPFSPTDYNFERRKMEEEVKQLKAECQHWKRLVKRQEDREGTPEKETDEAARLRSEVLTLQHRLDEIVERHQNELASLQEVHRSQLASIARSLENKGDEDGWGAEGSDWSNDDWSGNTAKEVKAGEIEVVNHQLENLQSENKTLREEKTTLERSLEEMDQEHSKAVEKLLRGRHEAEGAASELRKELAATKEELNLANVEKREAEERGKGEDGTVQELTNEILRLQNVSADLSQQLDLLSSSHHQTEQRLKEEREETNKWKEEMEQLQSEKTRLQEVNDDLILQCRELSAAYEELNGLYENEKLKSGAAVGDTQDLHQKLESLKNDLLEYEEKYERCKNDNLQSMKQLETLTSELERLKTEYFNATAAHAQTKKWRSEIVRLSKELEESLKKREELVKSVQEFQSIVDRFDRRIQRFREENAQLKRENEELRTASGASSPTDFRHVFEHTDQELQVLRRSLSEYQDAFVKKEKVWRDQMETLKEENEVLKTRTPSTPGSGRESDSGGEVMSSGSASYVHIDVASGGGNGNGGQPSPHSGSNDSGGVLIVPSERRSSRDLLFMEEGRDFKLLIDQQRQTIEELQERNRTLEERVLELSTKPDPTNSGENIGTKVVESSGWGDWTEDTEERAPEDRKVVEASVESVDNWRQLLDEKTKECEEMLQELEKMRTGYDELTERSKEDVDNLEAELAKCREREAEARNELTATAMELEKRKTEADQTLQSQHEALMKREELDALKRKTEELEALKRKTEELKRELKVVEGERDEGKAQIQRLEELVNRLDLEKKMVETALIESREVERSAREASTNSSQLLDELAILRSVNENLEASISTLRQENEKLRSDYDMVQAQTKEKVSGLLERIDQLENELDHTRQELDQRQTEFEAYKNNIEQRLRSVHEEKEHLLQMENETKENEFCAYKEDAERQLSSHSAMLESLNNEKQQLIVLLNQKHEESVRYHQECQRLGQLMAEEKTRHEVGLREMAAAAQKPTTENGNQTEDDALKEKISALEQELEACRNELERLTGYSIQLETQLKNERVEREMGVKNEMVGLKNEMMELIKTKEETDGRFTRAIQEMETMRRQLGTAEETIQKQNKETERLRGHLLQIEDAYTHEAVKAEERETELRKRLREAEQQLEAYLENEKDGTRMFSDQMSDLRTELESMAEQRDSALLQFADSQIELERLQKALNNLQAVLQRMQEEKDLVVKNEVSRYRKERDTISEEKRQVEQRLKQVQDQLCECQQHLNAVSSVNEQSGAKDKIIAELRSEINAKEDECSSLHAKLNQLRGATDARIDKELLKNILLGYFCAPVSKKAEVAHLLGAILGFSNDEFKKIELGPGTGGWLQFLRLGGGNASHSSSKSTEQSLAEQFVKFLEKESDPKIPATPMSTDPVNPSFPVGTAARTGPLNTSRSSTPGIARELPTFLSPLPTSSTDTGSDFLRDLLAKPDDGNVV